MGLCWQQQLRCTNCKYPSGLFELYMETKTDRIGPDIAAPNLGLQVALQDSTMGCAKARLLLAAILLSVVMTATAVAVDVR